jgi:CBS domain containing-hemolysin-like protein
MVLKTLLLPSIFFISSFALLAVKVSIRTLRSHAFHQELKKYPWYYFVLILIEKSVSKKKENATIDFLNLTGLITIIGYGISSTLYLLAQEFYGSGESLNVQNILLNDILWFFLAFSLILLIPLICYFVIHLFVVKLEYASLKLFSCIASVFLIIFLPVTWPLIWLKHRLTPEKTIDKSDEDARAIKIKHRLLELLQESDIKDLIDPQDKKLIKSIANFQDRVAREIMVPKIDIIAFSENMSIADAAPGFARERFSRIPIYNESIDLITGVLLYKDLLTFILEHLDKDPEMIKKTSLKTLAKPIIYAPEGKKISDLLQEMKQLQIHIIVVVNEYGCTEGIVTIEDILEEIVGEISDEHDVDEELLYTATNDNAWVVDARMNIIDLETETGITIPPDPEYETVGGFILHQINSFPFVGTIIHTDDFDIKVLSTGKRQIYKVKIIPIPEKKRH